MKTITIFTPTYNRAYILHQLYDSLCRQTTKDFEWLIVDDGSTDETEQMIHYWILENRIVIRYYKTANGGKNRAINKGVTLSNGELFFIVDSDDYLTDNAVKLILDYWATIKDKSHYSGVCGRKMHSNGELLGGNIKSYDVIDSDNITFHYILGINADIAEIFRTDLLREHPFPVAVGEKFVPEALIWNKLTNLYPMRYFNIGIYVCEYLPDGYTCNLKRNLKQNPKGFGLYYKSMLLNKRKLPILLRIKSLLRVCQCKYYELIKKLR